MKTIACNLLVGWILAVLPVLAFGQEVETADLMPFAAKVVTPETPYEYALMAAEVTVLFRLNEDGRTRDIEVESASSQKHAESVRRALKAWRFEGVESSERWTEVRFRLPFHFNGGRN